MNFADASSREMSWEEFAGTEIGVIGGSIIYLTIGGLCRLTSGVLEAAPNSDACVGSLWPRSESGCWRSD